MTAQELKRERIKRKHSQASIAQALGISLRQYIRYERVEAEIPEVVRLALKSVSSRYRK